VFGLTCKFILHHRVHRTPLLGQSILLHLPRQGISPNCLHALIITVLSHQAYPSYLIFAFFLVILKNLTLHRQINFGIINELHLWKQIFLCALDDHLEISFLLLAHSHWMSFHVNVLPFSFCARVDEQEQ
jgi:hypothetical protein